MKCNELRNCILMMYRYPDLASTSDWSRSLGNLLQPIRNTRQIWVVKCHQYGISSSFIRRHFAGKLVVASQNDGCFLRLLASMIVVVIITNTMPFALIFYLSLFTSVHLCSSSFWLKTSAIKIYARPLNPRMTIHTINRPRFERLGYHVI